jgi:quercetin dioxygenase-like cupin family protein
MPDDLAGRLRAEGLDPSRWSNGPGDRYGAHEHGYDKVIVVEHGSIRFGLPSTGGSLELAAGDRLELPAGARHDAVVGPAGVACLEAHLPAGSLDAVLARTAGTWHDETDGQRGT